MLAVSIAALKHSIYVLRFKSICYSIAVRYRKESCSLFLLLDFFCLFILAQFFYHSFPFDSCKTFVLCSIGRDSAMASLICLLEKSIHGMSKRLLLIFFFVSFTYFYSLFSAWTARAKIPSKVFVLWIWVGAAAIYAKEKVGDYV